MKKFLKSPYGKRLPFTLLLLAVAVVSGFLLKDMIAANAKLQQKIIWCLVVFGIGGSALVLLPMGWKGLLSVYGAIGLFILEDVLSELFPMQWAFVFVVIVLPLLLYLLWWRKKRAGGTAEKAAPAPLADEPILVQSGVHSYQLLRAPGELRAYRVDGKRREIDTSLLQDTGTPLRPLGKKDLSIPLDSILHVKLGYSLREFQRVLTVRMKTTRRSYKLTAVSGAAQEEQALRRFLAHQVPQQLIEQKTDREDTRPAAVPSRVKILRWVGFGLGLFALLINLYRLLPVYQPFAALALLPAPVLLALYCMFPHDIVMGKLSRTRASFILPLGLSCIAPLPHALEDFQIFRYLPLLVGIGVTTLVLTGILLLLSQEWHYCKSALACILLLFVYAIGFVPEANARLDRSEPERKTATVEQVEKYDRDYTLTVRYADGTTDQLEVNDELYAATTVGDEVTVNIHAGAFGIPYRYVWELGRVLFTF